MSTISFSSPSARPPQSPSAPPPPSAEVVSRPIRLVTARGLLDTAGVEALRGHLETLLADGVVALVVDLSGVTGCADGLFATLADIYAAAQVRQGWMRLVGLAEPVLAALDSATLPEALLVYRASSWALGDAATATGATAFGVA